MNWPGWIYIGIIVVVLLLGSYFVKFWQAADETWLPPWLFRALLVGFVLLMIAIAIGAASYP